MHRVVIMCLLFSSEEKWPVWLLPNEIITVLCVLKQIYSETLPLEQQVKSFVDVLQVNFVCYELVQLQLLYFCK
jgi:hypothetical protein